MKIQSKAFQPIVFFCTIKLPTILNVPFFLPLFSQPFLLYFNPTVPHSSNDIGVALRDFSCRDTANGKLGVDPMIPGMTKDYGGCTGYRQSIFDRSTSENDYGPIWLDDSVGALLKALEDKEILDNTVFLFQIDHGMDPKSSLYEGGVRIPQFIHYPDAIRAGTKFDGPVSTIDISKTMFDFAGIVPSYSMDGVSWKDAIAEGSEQSFWKEERCLFFELERDRAARCGCFKYLNIYEQNDSSSTYTRGNQNDLSNDLENIFDLCDGSSEYVTDKTRNTEATNLLSSNQAKVRFSLLLHRPVILFVTGILLTLIVSLTGFRSRHGT